MGSMVTFASNIIPITPSSAGWEMVRKQNHAQEEDQAIHRR
jgi:hypothetical protein